MNQIVDRHSLVAVTPVASMPAGCELSDLLLDAVMAFRRGIDEYNALAPRDEEADVIAEATYVPPMDVLIAWDQPATTLAGAREALRLMIEELRDHERPPELVPMLTAVLGYLDGQTPPPSVARSEPYAGSLAEIEDMITMHAVPATAASVATEPELPGARVGRLARELSEALDEYRIDDVDEWFVQVYSKKSERGYFYGRYDKVSPDAQLLALEKELAAEQLTLDGMEASYKRHPDDNVGAACDACYDRMMEIADRIEATPARTMVGLWVKARALEWCHSGEIDDFAEQPCRDLRLAKQIVMSLLQQHAA